MDLRVHGFSEDRAVVCRSRSTSEFERAVQGGEMLIRTVEQAKRWGKIVIGFTLLALGIVLVFSPAPGLLVALLGLGILAAEFVWAKRLLNHVKAQGERIRATVFPRVDKAA
jgi:uncharacterized protein (TIGR02611 family)